MCLQDIKRAAAKKQQWLAAGHGEYREAAMEKDFFAEMKGEERVVCHFYRDSWPCKASAAAELNALVFLFGIGCLCCPFDSAAWACSSV